MRAFTKTMITFGVLVMLVGGLYLFSDWFSKVTGYAFGEDDKIKLAQCLDGKNATLYVSPSCFSCDKQLEDFGETAAKFLKIEECDNVEDPPCSDLKGVPAWEIDGKFIYGHKTLEELGEFSGCEVD